MKLDILLSKSCLWLTILLPLFVIIGRGVADTALTLTAILFLLLSLIRRDIKPFQEKWFLFFLAFWIYMIAGSFFADDLSLSIRKSLPIIRFALFALCFQSLLKEHHNLTKKILCSVGIATAFLVINGYMQHFLGQDFFGGTKMEAGAYGRITLGFTDKPAIASILILLSSPLIYYALHQAIRVRKHIFISTAFCFLMYGLVFLSGERTAFFQTTLFIFLASLYLANFNPKLIIASVSILTLGILSIYYFGGKPIIERQFFSVIDALKNFGSNPYGKLWAASISIFMENILFGIGPMHFEKYCLPISDFCNYHSHNIYLELLSETGIVGFALFAASIYHILKPSIKLLNGKQDLLHIVGIAISIILLIRFLPFMPHTGLFKNWYAVPMWFVIGWLLHVNAIIKQKTKF